MENMVGALLLSVRAQRSTLSKLLRTLSKVWFERKRLYRQRVMYYLAVKCIAINYLLFYDGQLCGISFIKAAFA